MTDSSRLATPDAARTRTIAAFDFDGTLTTRHTLWRYLRFLVGAPRFYRACLALVPTALRVLLGSVPLMKARDLLFARLLEGFDAELEEQSAERFAREHIPAWLRPQGLERLKWHQSQGHATVIVSNSAESYLRHVGRALGFDAVLGTRLQTRSGRLTGHTLVPSCVSGEKVVRLYQYFGDLRRYRVYAYGDSAGDRELLAVADKPYLRPFHGQGPQLESDGEGGPWIR